jgi:hypothetical protein
MKLLGGTDDGRPPVRSQDDAAIHNNRPHEFHVFPRHPNEMEFPQQYTQKQTSRWGDDAIVDVSRI